MSRSTLTRGLMIAAMAVTLSSAADAAIQTYPISGNLTNWKTFNANSKSPMPYANAVAGVDIFQGSALGAVIDGTSYNQSYINIQVTGSISYDDSTNPATITALTLSQVAPVTGYYDTNGDGLTDAGGIVTFQNLTWALTQGGVDNPPNIAPSSPFFGSSFIRQTTPTYVQADPDNPVPVPQVYAVGCVSESPFCEFTVVGVNTNSHTNGGDQSIFDFQGINNNFQTLPQSNPAKDAYGTDSYKTWPLTFGATTLAGNTAASKTLKINFNTGSLVIDVSSRSFTLVTTNAANTAQFILQADLPQLACLSGEYWNGVSCVQADPGYFALGSGVTAQTGCDPGNYQPNPGQSSCIPASIAFYVDLPIATAQTACPVGQTTATQGSTNISACFVPSSCSAGSYDTGSSCALADPGYFVPNNGAVAQIACDAGKYQPNAGQTSCLNAQPGNFVANTASLTQTPCSPGSYQPSANQTACIPASANSFVPTSGASSQTACPNGQVSQPGATACTFEPTIGDADGDGVSDSDELLRGSSPTLIDTDSDGILDNIDPFPANPVEPTTQATTVYSQEKLSISGCNKGSRVIGAEISFLSGNYNLLLGDGLLMFGDYTTIKPAKKYKLNLSANSQTLLQKDLREWAVRLCGSNVELTLATPKFDMTVNKQQTQATVTLKAKVSVTVNGKVKNGSYTLVTKPMLSSGAPN
jgi:hypothetical protein